MSLFKPICRAAAPAEIPASAKIAYLALNLALWDRLGLIKKILTLFPDPAETLRIPAGDWPMLGIEPEKAGELASPGLITRAHKEFDRLAKKGYSLLTLGDVEYPSLLREIFDPPCVLYCAGKADVLGKPAVAGTFATDSSILFGR